MAPTSSLEFGTTREIRLSTATLRYREIGHGAPILFVHGAFVNGLLWREVAPSLAANHRCLVPDLPLGAHRLPADPDADLTLRGLARLVAEFMAALDLRDVTLVGNDTGGAICQLVAAHHPERVGQLVLTNCDAFENFVPPLVRPIVWASRLPGFAPAFGRLLRSRLAQRALLRLVARRPPDPVLLDAYFDPPTGDPAVLRDAVKLLRGVSNRYTLAAAARFAAFARPVLLVWAPEDRLLFPMRDAERLATAFPDARLVTVRGSLAFISEDQPQALVAAIGAFLTEEGRLAA